ncbi:MAG: glutamine-synthetase adenylyltransferase [Bryobacteraceae bacterium]|jgi:glutamate-ammonia-ligase adenylyltransferase
MQRLLGEIEFRDAGRAAGSLLHLTQNLTEESQARFRPLLAACADPDSALHFLDRLCREQPAAFERLASSTASLQMAIGLFSCSRFLSEAVVVHPEWMGELIEGGELRRPMPVEQYKERLEGTLAPEGQLVPSPLSLARFRRRQILRIVVRDILGLCTLSETTEEISGLADAILDVTYRRIGEDLRMRYGRPSDRGLSILSLGKLGGNELNYSSDIDLMFVYGSSGETEGPNRITNKEFYKKAANQLTGLLSTYTSAGVSYRVDLRLRPDGRLGEICTSLEGAKSYYQNRARDWELQMLIKARVSAGEREPGAELLEFVEPLIYSSTLDFSVVESASVTRERISEKLAARRGASRGFNIKLAPGGIRDIEFLVQCLQRLHGGREKWVRHGGTMLALSRLRDKDLLSATEYSRLGEAYQFLRALEHRLQFYGDRQIHALPKEPEILSMLAREMPASQLGSAPSADLLLRQVNQHLEEVQVIYERVIHAQQPVYYTPAPIPAAPGPPGDEPDVAPEPASNLVRFLDQRAPRLATTLARGNLRHGRVHFEHFLERILPHPEWMGWLDGDPVLASYVLDLFEHSPYFAEQLIRNPELTAELRHMREKPGPDLPYQDMIPALEDAGELRRFFRREMFRIQSESICLQTPIFTTLERTSDLADAVITGAYRMAVEQVASKHPPAGPGYQPVDQMAVITMGRLGMREFDLASDADLVFVIPDRDTAEQVFWTRVAERLISIASAYTGDGMMFAVDTRLRPNGREGALVQPEMAYKDYFSNVAQAWEGITYMKTRAVAGDVERGTRFLNELQEVDWRRYGQSGRSRKQLVQMRLRLEKEQGGGNRLKAGQGGYYDIDFALMYLRLKGAGIFYRVLNTPDRIDVIEKMGHLDRSDASFLRDAATFHRALDHGLRILTGHAEGDLPAAGWQLETLTALMRRWMPEHLQDQPLDVELAQIQARTREFFDRLFTRSAPA